MSWLIQLSKMISGWWNQCYTELILSPAAVVFVLKMRPYKKTRKELDGLQNLNLFPSGFSFRHWWFTEQQAKGGNHLYSSLPLVPTQEHWDIYLQLCMWDDYHKILFLSFITTRLLLNEIYHLIELPLLTKFQFL